MHAPSHFPCRSCPSSRYCWRAKVWPRKICPERGEVQRQIPHVSGREFSVEGSKKQKRMSRKSFFATEGPRLSLGLSALFKNTKAIDTVKTVSLSLNSKCVLRRKNISITVFSFLATQYFHIHAAYTKQRF